ncbi:MAG: hypothetical protein ACKVOA_06620 [Methylophilaceae bacterium]
MDAEKEQKALSAYAKFLHGRHISSEAIALRVKFLEKLAILLQGKSTREEYGKALETALKVEGNIERHQQLNIAREFFPFWIDDVKMIARMSETYGYDLSISQLKPLPALSVDELNSHKLDANEEDLLSRYAKYMKEQNLADDLVQARIRLAKLVLIRLRDIPIKNNVSYRMAVEATLPLFNVDDIRQRFLLAIREFFYIWIAKVDPNYTPIFTR